MARPLVCFKSNLNRDLNFKFSFKLKFKLHWRQRLASDISGFKLTLALQPY